MSDAQGHLTLTQGSSRPVDIEVVDQHGNLETGTAPDRASLWIGESMLASAAVLERSTQAGTLSVAEWPVLTATLTSETADALTPGELVGQVNLRFAEAVP